MRPYATFLCDLIQPGSSEASHNKIVKLKAIAQDIIFVISNGEVVPPKHVLLARAIKTLTGNVELVKIVNRLGHGTSNTVLYEMDTALCLKKLAETGNSLGIPNSFLPCIPTHLAYDNIDRLEETLDGSGTSHRVNGIILQPKVPTVSSMKKWVKIVRTKKLSIEGTANALPSCGPVRKLGPFVNHEPDANHLSAAEIENDSIHKNRVWTLARKLCVEDTTKQNVPSWTGFNIVTRQQEVTKDKIGYLPTINAPATLISTVSAIMDNALAICNSLELDEIAVCFDQSLYAKAAEIKWSAPDKYSPIILTLGAFHTICTFLSIIGKRFEDSGIRDIAVESGVLNEGSVDQVFEGRQYNRGVRFHKIMYEALYRRIWEGFNVWCAETYPEDMAQYHALTEDLLGTCTELSGERLNELLAKPHFEEINKKFGMYLSFLRTDNGDLSNFWMSYVVMVEILLGLIRASREGNWDLHLLKIEQMIPFCFAYGKTNYARYLPIYLHDMKVLPIEHPKLHQYFVQGGFSAQIGNDNTFGRIPIDQTIEETVNKDTQTPGGTKGFSLQPNAIYKHYMTAEYRSASLHNLRKMTDSLNSTNKHKDLCSSRISKDEKDVNAIVDLVGPVWTNPFSHPSELASLSTGKGLPPSFKDDVLNAENKGKEAYQAFKSRMIPGETCKRIYEPIKNLKLKTFSENKKRKTVKNKSKELVLKADTALFGHMLLIAENRNLDVQKVLAHPLGPIPFSIARATGEMASTNKAELAKTLESKVQPIKRLSGDSATIIDGMALVHRINAKDSTFGQVSSAVLKLALREAHTSIQVDIVFDVYKDISIKNDERTKRGSNNTSLCNEILANQKVRQWDQILSSPKSKSKLIQFFFNDWRKYSYAEQLEGKVLFVTSGEQCVIIDGKRSVLCNRLFSSQEEADSRLLLHAHHASKNHDNVIMVARDTDILAIALGVVDKIPNLYIKRQTPSGVGFVSVNEIAKNIGNEQSRAIPGYHSFTGCDSVSSFAGKGKKIGLKLMLADERIQKYFSQLGEEWELPEDVFQELARFTCLLYSSKTHCTSPNNLRYEIFRLKKGVVQSGQLPPCEDVLRLQAMRANYQAAIWRRCLEPYPIVPSPDEHGWKITANSIEIQWMSGPPAPEAILEFLSCKCKRACKAPRCQCVNNNLRCTAACKLQNCNNAPAIQSLDDTDSDSDQ